MNPIGTILYPHHYAVTWDHDRVLMLMFDGMNYSSVIWHEFEVIIGIRHKGSISTIGYYQVVLFNSGCGLLCDDTSIW